MCYDARVSLPLRSPPLHTDAPGAGPDAFGPFRVVHQIGAGTLGPVYRAVDPDGNRIVAVKVFALDLPPDRAYQLVAEFDRVIAASLTYPGIVTPIAAGLSGERPYLVQDFVAGESLDVALRQFGPAPAADAVRVAAQLAGALDFAAIVNVDHGALHPRDVLLTATETRMSGLGIARALEHVGVAVPVRRPYTAPERLIGPGSNRRAADMFSLAALIHELLWGRPIAGTGPRVAEALTPIDQGNLPRLKWVFARALDDDPHERFPTALEFVEALKNACPGVTLVRPTAAAPHVEPARVEIGSPLPVEQPQAPAPTQAATSVPVAAAPTTPTPGLTPTPVSGLTPTSAPSLTPAAVASGFSRTEKTPDLDLRAAEEARYTDVEAAPSIVDDIRAPLDAPFIEPSIETDSLDDSTAPHETTPAVPLLLPTDAAVAGRKGLSGAALALIVAAGIALGFGLGYLVVQNRQPQTAPPPAAEQRSSPPSTPQRPGPAPREFTESTVPDTTQVRPAPETGAARPDVRLQPGSTETRRPDAGQPGRPDGTQPGRPGAANPGAPDTARRGPAGTQPPASRDARSANTRSADGRRPNVPAPGKADGPNTATPNAQTNTPGITAPRAGAAASAAAAAPAFPGRLLVRSTPAGATVFVDGRAYGQTPVAVRDLAPGAHRVRLVRDGYLPAEQRVVITRTQPAQSLTITLPERGTAPAGVTGSRTPPPSTSATMGRFTGALVIDSRPAGARVFMDNRLVGTTPLVLDAVRAGEHALRLERDGYRRWTTQARIIAGERNRITASLER